MNENRDVIGEFEIVKNMALMNRIPSSSIHYEQTDLETLCLVIYCHENLTMKLYYDIEWTIDYHYPGGSGADHNHIQDWQRDEYINRLFKGEIYFLIDRRFLKKNTNSEFNFIDINKLDKYKRKFANKKKVKLFSTREIWINN